MAVQRYWVRTRTNTLLEEIVRRLPKNSRILDLGCGSGVFIEKLKEKGFKNIIGLDINLEHLKYSLTIDKNNTLVLGKGEELPFRRKFDAVICAEVIEHTKEPFKMLKEMRRILKPGGLLFITTPNKKSSFPILWEMWKRWKGKIWSGKELHETDFTPASLKELMEKSGFDVIRTRTILSVSYLIPFFERKGWVIDIIPDKIGFGCLILLIARKSACKPS
ncbi:MAG: hypothetical protein DRP11_03810 [Candidatus Aenigmatarchaeota archaeon]|nr:MAG: hypothetical protein DRP11_03810 [Candidatus Aenigmarchaeota archaeon]